VCNVCLSFHPSQPNILAVGTFNGELYLYDISSNSELAHSTIDDYYHRECITSILWLQDESVFYQII
jgi:WD40 repeat protein